jgi:hypothetical protein
MISQDYMVYSSAGSMRVLHSSVLEFLVISSNHIQLDLSRYRQAWGVVYAPVGCG